MKCPPGCLCAKHDGGFKGKPAGPCPDGCTCGRHSRAKMTVPGYWLFHRRLRFARGSASKFLCPCGAQAYQWAYMHRGDPEYVHNGFRYSLDFNDYLPLCVPCHKVLDRVVMV